MKKLILSILAVGAVASVQAQKPGSLLIFGNIGYSSDKTTDNNGLPGAQDVVTKNKTWMFNPGVGYQFNKNMTAGVLFGYNAGKTSLNQNGTTSSNENRDFQAGLFLRNTMALNKTFFVYNQLSASYLTGKTISDDGIIITPNKENTYNGFRIGWFPAVGINFTHNMALNFSWGGIDYTQKTWDATNNTSSPQYSLTGQTKEQGFNFTWGSQFNVGVSVNMGGHHMRGHHHLEPGMERRHMDMSDDDDAPKTKKSNDDDDE